MSERDPNELVINDNTYYLKIYVICFGMMGMVTSSPKYYLLGEEPQVDNGKEFFRVCINPLRVWKLYKIKCPIRYEIFLYRGLKKLDGFEVTQHNHIEDLDFTIFRTKTTKGKKKTRD